MANWMETSEDPNCPAVITSRQAEFDDAREGPTSTRNGYFLDRARGRRVLDIGCVEHFVDASDHPDWLHGLIVDAARVCTGVDIHADGVANLREQGFDVVHHDITTGLGPLADRQPYEVITCGEIIEHLRDPQSLLDAAAALLTEDGELVLSTPNPYAPMRASAGARGVQWESVDHVTYLFPSGMAELASRSGLEMTAVTSTSPSSRWTHLVLALGLRSPGLAISRALGPLGRPIRRRLEALDPRRAMPLATIAAYWRIWNEGLVGETLIYRFALAADATPLSTDDARAEQLV